MIREGRGLGVGKRGWVCVFFAILLVVGSRPVLAESPSAASRCRVQCDRGDLTVFAEDVPLADLLKAIEGETGIRFSVDRKESEKRISAGVGPAPVVQVLRRLLKGFNHVVQLGPEKEVVRVVILGEGTEEVLERTEPAIPEPNAIAAAAAFGMKIDPPSPDCLKVMPAKETITIRPASQDTMVVMPPTEVMVIRPATEEDVRLLSPQ